MMDPGLTFERSGEFMEYAVTGDALGIARSVRELRPEDRLRVLKLVDLMSVAREEARVRAQTMIRETLPIDPEARERCVETIDATIQYLEWYADWRCSAS